MSFYTRISIAYIIASLLLILIQPIPVSIVIIWAIGIIIGIVFIFMPPGDYGNKHW